MGKQGWISLYRKIEDNWLWDDKPFARGQAWIDLLILANHQDNKVFFEGQVVEMIRGSKITSLRKLSDRWGWSLTKTKKFLEELQNEKMLVYKSDSKKTIYTIVNYSSYQTRENIESNTEVTLKEHQSNTEVTLKETDNNVNNANNANNNINIYIVEQVVDYLNAKTGKSFKHTSKMTRSKINARLEEGFTLDDFKKVIDIKTSEWLNDANMQLYLRPETLFGNKFEGYLNQKAARVSQETAGKDHNNFKFKNKFNNFEGQSSQYTEEELNAIALNAKKRRQQEDSK